MGARVDNVVSPRHLGRHSYRKRSVEIELNGLVYTCKAGVVDVAHIRDYADMTAHLFGLIMPVLGSPVLVRLPYEGARREVLLRAPPKHLSVSEKRELAILLAQTIAWEMSVWHEIVTWYDFRSVPLVSERVSAYSPEDIYSNALGTFIGAEALRSGGDYDSAVDMLLAKRLRFLGALPPTQTRANLDAVEGVWWDRTRRLPDIRAVPRRNILRSSQDVQGWLVPAPLSPGCKHRREKPHTLKIPVKGPTGLVLSDLYEMRIFVDSKAMPTFDHPETSRPWVSATDFPWINERIREHLIDDLGPRVDTPHLYADRGKGTATAPDASGCGPLDANSAEARSEVLDGIRVGRLWLGGGNHPGILAGFSAAALNAPGGNLDFLKGAFDFHDEGWSFGVRMLSMDDGLLLCRRPADTEAGETEIPYPWFQPLDPKCLGGSWLGFRLDLVLVSYESEFVFMMVEPVRLGLAWNILANGHTRGWLDQRLVLSVDVAPMFFFVKSNWSDTHVNSFLRLHYLQRSLARRLVLDVNAWIGGNMAAEESNISGGVSASLAWNFLARSSARRGKQTVFTLGLETSISGASLSSPIPPGYGRYTRRDKDFIGGDQFGLNFILFLESSLPSLSVM